MKTPATNNNAAGLAAAGGERSPLSRFQKMLLAKAARRAWLARGSPAPGEAAWRREQALRTAGVRISQARQSDYANLRACFLDAQKRHAAAFNVLVTEPQNKVRIARWKLLKECVQRRLPLSYPEAICRRQFRRPLDEATAKQLWCLIFTIRNRRPAPNPRSAQSARSVQS